MPISRTHFYNFNPRSYKRSDDKSVASLNEQIRISIHAPTRGATDGSFSDAYPTLISIHAPTRGATEQMAEFKKNGVISIHAPTRGAT